MPDYEWPAPGWPAKGEKVYYLAANGHDHQREAADKILTKGQELTVRNCNIGGWTSSYEFEEFPGQWFNTVMFTGPKLETTPDITKIEIIETVGSDALPLIEHAFRAGFTTGWNAGMAAAHSGQNHTTEEDQAWSAYDPSETPS